jgi:hypothetical protein
VFSVQQEKVLYVLQVLLDELLDDRKCAHLHELASFEVEPPVLREAIGRTGRPVHEGHKYGARVVELDATAAAADGAAALVRVASGERGDEEAPLADGGALALRGGRVGERDGVGARRLAAAAARQVHPAEDVRRVGHEGLSAVEHNN